MDLDRAACYRALLARDRRFDGQFFTCVKTTGIYCRPICPARTPKFENCIFLPTAAAAQEAGFRPCLRCRPESSPDLGAWRGSSATVSRAMRLIEGGALDEAGVDALADRLGIGERQLRRLFRLDDPRLFDPRRNLDEAIGRLRALPGVGEWTAQYIAMRAMRESDAFLAADVGLQRMLAVDGRRPNASELLTRAERWRPWRAYAVLHLWMAEAPAGRPSQKENANAFAA